jgi:hypothetical protein
VVSLSGFLVRKKSSAALWNVVNKSCDEAPDFAGVCVPSGEGLGRKRNTRDCSGKRSVMFETLLGVSSFSRFECFALTPNALGFL